ncbi:hypothetical protein ACHAXT_001116 [Thalassiosira profunda]
MNCNRGLDATAKHSGCCVRCTTPKDACCLECADVSPPRERDLLMAMMEGLTHHIMDKHSGDIDKLEWLRTRAWEGNSHIGNRPEQATFYYDWVRSLTIDGDAVRHVCEVGMNGGHSALILLAAIAGQNDAKLTMFDIEDFTYSQTAKQYIEILYPRQFTLHTGDSKATVPRWTAEQTSEKCDVFSVDGDHSFEGARVDILNAIKATRKGGAIILDDVNPGGPTRQAFDSVLGENMLANVRCIDAEIKVGYDDRTDSKHARTLPSAWCMATVV